MHFNSDVKLQISCDVQVTELRVTWSGNSGGGGGVETSLIHFSASLGY